MQQKTIKAHVYSATNLTALPKQRKMAPTKLPTIASNVSIVFQQSLLRASAILVNHFSKTPLPFGGDDPEAAGPPSPPTVPLITSVIVEIFTQEQ